MQMIKEELGGQHKGMDEFGYGRSARCGTSEAGMEEPHCNSFLLIPYDATRVKGHDDDSIEMSF